MNLHNLKYVIFDMDGLLVDSESVYARGWKYALRANNVNASEEFILSMVGRSTLQNLEQIYGITGDYDVAKEVRQIRETYIQSELQSGNICAKPYVEKLLQFLKEHDIKMAVASSSPNDRGMSILNHLSLSDFFHVGVFGNDVKHHKPAPDVYLSALDQLGATADITIAVEDSSTGAQAAINAGLNVMLVPDLQSPSDAILNSQNVIGVFDSLLDVYNRIKITLE